MRTPEASGRERLLSLLGLFPESPLRPERFEFVAPEELPTYYGNLLAHNYHMTVTLETHHQSRVQLAVLDEFHRGDDYARRLLLQTEPPQSTVAMVGAMRIHLQHCDEEVRSEILEGKKPLGRILIEHEVLRWIEPEAFLRVDLDAELKALYRREDAEESFGRLATIYYNGEPAVELLEMVAPRSP